MSDITMGFNEAGIDRSRKARTQLCFCACFPKTFIHYIFVRVQVSDYEVEVHHIQVQISDDEGDAKEVQKFINKQLY